MPLVLNAFTRTSGITGMTLCKTSSYFTKLHRGSSPAQYVNTNHGCMGMWHASRPSILPLGFLLYGTEETKGELMAGVSSSILPTDLMPLGL